MKYCDTCSTAYPTDFNVCPRDNTPLRASSEIMEGLIIAKKYCILEKIGAGGMATVYRARHLAFNEIRAIKVVNQRLADENFLKRFKGEAIITRKLQHPNAVRVDDFDFTEDGRPFIVMEYVEGESLRKILKTQGPLGADRALRIARQVAEALKAAHALGIIHRDIKPDNVLLAEVGGQKDFVKVLDFGIAKVQEGAFEVSEGEDFAPTQAGFVVGTPAYISPEQARGKKAGEIDGRADLYSLGVVVYEMLTGELPFHSETSMEMILHHLHTPVTPPHKLKPQLGIPLPLSRLLLKAMEKEREDRFQSADEMLEALRDPTEWARRQAYSAAGVTPLRVPVAVAAQDEGPLATGIRGSENYEAGRPLPARRGPIYDGPAAGRVPAVFARDAALPTLSLGGYAAEAELERRRPRRWPWFVLLFALLSASAGYFYAYPASLRADAAVARLAYERAREKYRAWRGRPSLPSPPSSGATSPPEEDKPPAQDQPSASAPAASDSQAASSPSTVNGNSANSPSPTDEQSKSATPSEPQPAAAAEARSEASPKESAGKDNPAAKPENPSPTPNNQIAKAEPASPRPVAMPRSASSTAKGEVFGVVYESSQPAAHVTVELESPGLGFDQSTVTDGDGKYRFTRVPPGGGYVLTAIRNGSAMDTRSGLVIHPGPRSISPPLRMEGQNAEPDTVRVYGRVFDAGNKPVPGVTVKLENEQLKIARGAVTAADGAYSFTHVPPAQGYQMSIIKNGSVASRTSVTVQPARVNPEQVVLLYLKSAPQ